LSGSYTESVGPGAGWTGSGADSTGAWTTNGPAGDRPTSWRGGRTIVMTSLPLLTSSRPSLVTSPAPQFQRSPAAATGRPAVGWDFPTSSNDTALPEVGGSAGCPTMVATSASCGWRPQRHGAALHAAHCGGSEKGRTAMNPAPGGAESRGPGPVFGRGT